MNTNIETEGLSLAFLQNIIAELDAEAPEQLKAADKLVQREFGSLIRLAKAGNIYACTVATVAALRLMEAVLSSPNKDNDASKPTSPGA